MTSRLTPAAGRAHAGNRRAMVPIQKPGPYVRALFHPLINDPEKNKWRPAQVAAAAPRAGRRQLTPTKATTAPIAHHQGSNPEGGYKTAVS